MNTVLNLFDMGENPDEVRVCHMGDILHIYIKGRHAAMITGVHKHIRRDKNYPGKYTTIVVEHYDERENKINREVIATLFHKKSLVEDITKE